MSGVDVTLRIAREVQPDLWARTEQVARIIDPAAFDDNWLIDPPEASRLHAARLAVMRSTAMSKAHEVLRVLGVNTETDWFEILTRLAMEST